MIRVSSNFFNTLLAAIWPKSNTIERMDSRNLRIKIPESPTTRCYSCDSMYNVDHFNYCPCLESNDQNQAHRRIR